MKQFKSESKRLLDLMINSIYTNKEIFLRELISNASDAIDKLYYRSLTDKKFNVNKDDLAINIKLDKDKRIMIISDNGCGMTKEELENNLGTIAKSGSLAFKEMAKKNQNVDIIGQFGVGFYSAFMVSDDIRVVSKAIDSDKAYEWFSKGSDGYEIKESSKDTIGTDIILHLKKDLEDEKYSDYLEEYKVKILIKKYSDYIRYPIKMEEEKEELVDKDKKEYKKTKEIVTLNSMVPLWKKDKGSVKEEEYDRFYQDEFYDYEKPLKTMSVAVEGACTYKGLLFIPSHAPMDYYTKEYEKGLSLYANGVLIMEKCRDLLPDYYSFVKGVIDSEDLSLNISREMLQKTKALHLIAKSIETKVHKELLQMMKEDMTSYEKFYKAFGMQLKFGVYNNYGMDKDKLQDLLMFYSAKNKGLVSLKDYVEKMKEGQESIYYACGETIDKIDNLPQIEQVKDKDYDLLYLTDYVDEFAINALMEYDKRKFVNISSENFDLDNEDEKERLKKVNEDNKEMLNLIKEEIKVSEVKLTNKLKKHAVCLTSMGSLSTSMSKVINAMPTDEKVEASMVLEINESHPIVIKLQDLYHNNREEFSKYTKILYAEALLIEGLPIDNPTEISNLICEVMSK